MDDRLASLRDIRLPDLAREAALADGLLAFAAALLAMMILGALLRPVLTATRRRNSALAARLAALDDQPAADRLAGGLGVLKQVSGDPSDNWPQTLADRFGTRHVDLDTLAAARRQLYSTDPVDPAPVMAMARTLIHKVRD